MLISLSLCFHWLQVNILTRPLLSEVWIWSSNIIDDTGALPNKVIIIYFIVYNMFILNCAAIEFGAVWIDS